MCRHTYTYVDEKTAAVFSYQFYGNTTTRPSQQWWPIDLTKGIHHEYNVIRGWRIHLLLRELATLMKVKQKGLKSRDKKGGFVTSKPHVAHFLNFSEIRLQVLKYYC